MNTPAGRHLFIYWKVDAAVAHAATDAAQAMQRTLAAEHPLLRASLFCRTEEGKAQATLMEVYAAAPGVDETLQAAIEAAAARALAPFVHSQRHVEVFTAR